MSYREHPLRGILKTVFISERLLIMNYLPRHQELDIVYVRRKTICGEIGITSWETMALPYRSTLHKEYSLLVSRNYNFDNASIKDLRISRKTHRYNTITLQNLQT